VWQQILATYLGGALRPARHGLGCAPAPLGLAPLPAVERAQGWDLGGLDQAPAPGLQPLRASHMRRPLRAYPPQGATHHGKRVLPVGQAHHPLQCLVAPPHLWGRRRAGPAFSFNILHARLTNDTAYQPRHAAAAGAVAEAWSFMSSAHSGLRTTPSITNTPTHTTHHPPHPCSRCAAALGRAWRWAPPAGPPCPGYFAAPAHADTCMCAHMCVLIHAWAARMCALPQASSLPTLPPALLKTQTKTQGHWHGHWQHRQGGLRSFQKKRQSTTSYRSRGRPRPHLELVVQDAGRHEHQVRLLPQHAHHLPPRLFEHEAHGLRQAQGGGRAVDVVR